jgi:hypothetical protein
MVFMLLGI